MINRSILAGLAGVALLSIAPAVQAAPDSGKDFVKQAIQGDVSEVQLGKLAEEKGGTAQVRDFGKTLVTDHSAHEQKADSLAKAEGVTPPNQPTDEAQQEYQKLSQLSGKQFDKEFASYMVKDHEKDIKDFQQEADNKSDGQVAQFASETLPTLHKHLSMAQSIEKQQTAER